MGQKFLAFNALYPARTVTPVLGDEFNSGRQNINFYAFDCLKKL